MSRVIWLAAGAAAGAYATVKGRRAAERLSAPGLVDQAAALGTGWREFRTEMQVGMTARQNDFQNRLGQGSDQQPAIEPPDQKDQS